VVCSKSSPMRLIIGEGGNNGATNSTVQYLQSDSFILFAA